jgi:hypothetical protein
LVEYASINDFAELWKHEYHAVVLFSHWNKNGIDFQEGTVPIDKVVESIPVKTLAILDLCVCHPQNLVDRLCVTPLSLLTKSIWQEAEPREWCMFYGALFNLLRHKEYSYPDGVDQIAKEFMRKHYKGRNSQNERKSQKDN